MLAAAPTVEDTHRASTSPSRVRALSLFTNPTPTHPQTLCYPLLQAHLLLSYAACIFDIVTDFFFPSPCHFRRATTQHVSLNRPDSTPSQVGGGHDKLQPWFRRPIGSAQGRDNVRKQGSDRETRASARISTKAKKIVARLSSRLPTQIIPSTQLSNWIKQVPGNSLLLTCTNDCNLAASPQFLCCCGLRLDAP